MAEHYSSRNILVMVNRDRPPKPSITINRLLTLKKGQKFTYYTGHLPHDIIESQWDRGGCRAAHVYAALLTQIQELVAKQHLAGRIRRTERVTERHITRARTKDGEVTHWRIPVVEYIAEGL